MSKNRTPISSAFILIEQPFGREYEPALWEGSAQGKPERPALFPTEAEARAEAVELENADPEDVYAVEVHPCTVAEDGAVSVPARGILWTQGDLNRLRGA